MNAARQRRAALQHRIEQQHKKPQQFYSEGLAALLQESIKRVKTKKAAKLGALVFLKANHVDGVQMHLNKEAPTQQIMAMQRSGFWTEQDGYPIFIPPYSIRKVMILGETHD